MPARDKIHDAVKNALVKAGWVITADPYIIKYDDVKLEADLAADRPLEAERDGSKIVVEIKSFLGDSPMRDLELAIGQFEVYRGLLEVTAPDRQLYLAVSDVIYARVFERKAVQLIIKRFQVAMVVVDIMQEEVVKWISWPSGVV